MKKKILAIFLSMVLVVSCSAAIHAYELGQYRSDSGEYASGTYETSLFFEGTLVWASIDYSTESPSDTLPVSLSGWAYGDDGSYQFSAYGQTGSCADSSREMIWSSAYCNYRVNGDHVSHLAITN